MLAESESLTWYHPPALGARAAYQFVNSELYAMGNRVDVVGSVNIMAAGNKDHQSDINPSCVVLYVHEHKSDLIWSVPGEFYMYVRCRRSL